MGVGRSVLHTDFDRAVKHFILAYQMPVPIAASLPGKRRRDDLEELGWTAVQEAIKFAKAQEDPALRLLAMRVVSSLIRTELAILHEQDQAAVDALVEELEADRGELASKAGESERKKAAS